MFCRMQNLEFVVLFPLPGFPPLQSCVFLENVILGPGREGDTAFLWLVHVPSPLPPPLSWFGFPCRQIHKENSNQDGDGSQVMQEGGEGEGTFQRKMGRRK